MESVEIQTHLLRKRAATSMVRGGCAVIEALAVAAGQARRSKWPRMISGMKRERAV